ncbi:MAG: PD40 domain-containing protein [Deltaproteobacteria bacterium]|nr:PD40 domain-containing protein [Deltaproteobacteria bacterium]
MTFVMRFKIIIYIMLGALLIAVNGISADAPPIESVEGAKTENVGQKNVPEDKEPADSVKVILIESEPEPKIEPETGKPGETAEEAIPKEDKPQIIEEAVEPERSEPTGEASDAIEPKSEPEQEPKTEKPDEVVDEAKPEENKSQTAKQDTELEKETPKEPKELKPLYVRELFDIKAGQNDSNPVWSPSGKKIAFERSIGDKREVIISGLNGVVVQKIYCKLSDKKNEEMDFFFPGIAEDISYNSGMSWSPAEGSLVFMSNGGSGNYDLYLLPQLGNESTIRLTDDDEKDSHPQWSPVADHLIFVSGRSGKANIYLMKLETKETIQITNGEKTYLYPQWSPDGEKIAMIYGSNENHDIYLIGDITKPVKTLKALTTWSYDDLRPAWSPDGKKIAFYSNYNLQEDPKVWALFVIAADGSDPTEGEELYAKVVATNVIPDIESGPAWMPDSKRIIYVKNDRQAYNPIYVVNVDKKTEAILKTTTKMNHDVVCSSDGTIAFRAQIEQWDHIYIAILPN